MKRMLHSEGTAALGRVMGSDGHDHDRAENLAHARA